MLTEQALSEKWRPAVASSPSHLATSTRRLCAWPKMTIGDTKILEHSCEYVVGALVRRLGCILSTRAAVDEDVPAGLFQANLGSCQSLVVAVVPLHERRVDFSLGAEAGELAGRDRPRRSGLTSTREGLEAGKPRFQGFCVADAVLVEGNVGPAGVTATSAPARRRVGQGQCAARHRCSSGPAGWLGSLLLHRSNFGLITSIKRADKEFAKKPHPMRNVHGA